MTAPTQLSTGSELLPCPFCASPAEPWDANHTSVQGFEIVCTNRKCGASTGLFPTKPMAVRAWNTRTVAQASQVEESADCCEWWQEQYRQQAARIEELEGRGAAYTAKGPAKPEPTRWPAKGDQMKFLGVNGYPFELEKAKKIFKVGESYRVHACNVESWSHSIQFDGVKGWFNGVMFERTSEHPSTEGNGRG